MCEWYHGLATDPLLFRTILDQIDPTTVSSDTLTEAAPQDFTRTYASQSAQPVDEFHRADA